MILDIIPEIRAGLGVMSLERKASRFTPPSPIRYSYLFCFHMIPFGFVSHQHSNVDIMRSEPVNRHYMHNLSNDRHEEKQTLERMRWKTLRLKKMLNETCADANMRALSESRPKENADNVPVVCEPLWFRVTMQFV